MEEKKRKLISRRTFIKAMGLGFFSVGFFPWVANPISRAFAAIEKDTTLKIDPVAVAYDPTVINYPPKNELAIFSRAKNPVYSMVEKALAIYNPENPLNPLKGIVNLGDKVVIKPNFCHEAHYPLPITHPAVLEPIIQACVNSGAKKITIAEGPMNPSTGEIIFGSKFTDMERIVSAYREKYPMVEINYVDTNKDDFTWVYLGEKSHFYPVFIDGIDLYHPGFTSLQNSCIFYAIDSKGFCPEGFKVGLYAISNTYLEADVFIGVPKIKTHGMSGITIALKNLMGINRSTTKDMLLRQGRERYLKMGESHIKDVPHFDGRTLEVIKVKAQFEKMEKQEASIPKDELERLRKTTNWNAIQQNDVFWRSLADLHLIINYVDRNGKLKPDLQRRTFHIVDGIIGMEGPGPVCDQPYPTGAIVAGRNPVEVDMVCATIMGWIPERINIVRNLSKLPFYPLKSPRAVNECLAGVGLDSKLFTLRYKPPYAYSEAAIGELNVLRKG